MWLHEHKTVKLSDFRRYLYAAADMYKARIEQVDKSMKAGEIVRDWWLLKYLSDAALEPQEYVIELQIFKCNPSNSKIVDDRGESIEYHI